MHPAAIAEGARTTSARMQLTQQTAALGRESRQARSLDLGGYGSGGACRPKRAGYKHNNRIGGEVAISADGICGVSATTGTTHTVGQAAKSFPPGALSGHPLQSPPDMSMPDDIPIFTAMSLAWTAERLSPAATNTASSKAKNLLVDHDITAASLPWTGSVLNTCAMYSMRQKAANCGSANHVSVPRSSKRQNFTVRSVVLSSR